MTGWRRVAGECVREGGCECGCDKSLVSVCGREGGCECGRDRSLVSV